MDTVCSYCSYLLPSYALVKMLGLKKKEKEHFLTSGERSINQMFWCRSDGCCRPLINLCSDGLPAWALHKFIAQDQNLPHGSARDGSVLTVLFDSWWACGATMSARVSVWRFQADVFLWRLFCSCSYDCGISQSVQTRSFRMAASWRSAPGRQIWATTAGLDKDTFYPVWMCVGFCFTSTLIFFHSFMLKRLKCIRFEGVTDVNGS